MKFSLWCANILEKEDFKKMEKNTYFYIMGLNSKNVELYFILFFKKENFKTCNCNAIYTSSLKSLKMDVLSKYTFFFLTHFCIAIHPWSIRYTLFNFAFVFFIVPVSLLLLILYFKYFLDFMSMSPLCVSLFFLYNCVLVLIV